MTAPARPSDVMSRKVRFSVRPPGVVVMRMPRVFAFGSHEFSAFAGSNTCPAKCPPNQRKSRHVRAREQDHARLVAERLRQVKPRAVGRHGRARGQRNAAVAPSSR